MKSFVAAVMKIDEIKNLLYEQTSEEINNEIQKLCSKSDPSILRNSSKEAMESFSWNDINKELQNRAPRFVQFVKAAVNNPSHSRNVHKKDDIILSAMCDAACKLISIFNENMSLPRKIISVILKKAGLKKVGFMRLQSLYDCMSYNSTCTILESLGSRFDEKLYEWKDAVEKGAHKEEDLYRQLNDAKSLKDHELAMKITTELIDHQETMHPGHSFTGDNVDIRVTPRKMTMKNQTSDIHLFQYVAFKNRVSNNHLSNEIPNVACKDIPLTSFLPSVSEQQLLVNELTVLVGHKWATYIPSLKWFHDFLPKHIQHNHMNETKTKTEKVILLVEKTQSSNFAPFSVLLFDVNKENCPPLLRAIELYQHSWQS
mgnify:FL=1